MWNSVRSGPDLRGRSSLWQQLLGLLVLAIVVIGCKPSPNARSLPLEGIRAHVCGQRPFDAGKNTCGERSIWLEADTGVVAYVTIYGIASKDEAVEAARYLKQEKRRLGHEIPIVVAVYSTPRQQGREPKSALLIDERF